MNATRVRSGSIVEWLIAATLIAGVGLLGAVALYEAPIVRAVISVKAEQPPLVDAPAGVPPRAVSLPVLLLADGKTLRLGDAASAVAGLLGPYAQFGAETVERLGPRDRIVRPYAYAGQVFDLIFEASTPDTEPRVTAIYLH